MVTPAGAIASPPLRAPRIAGRRDRVFFGSIAVALTVTVFAGFAQTYYLKGYLGPAPDLTPGLRVHGIVFTAWMLLLVGQTSLIAAGRRNLHRRLGYAGVGLALLMVIVGTSVAITRAAQGVLGEGTGIPPLPFLAVPLMGMVVFPILFGAAVYFRRRSDIHKRLVLLATVELTTAAIARLPVVAGWGPLGFFGGADLFVLGLVLYDLMTLRRLHKATLWGGLILVASQPLRLIIAGTPAWQAVASWLTG